MTKALKKAAQAANVAVAGWNLKDLEDAIQEQALRIVQYVAASEDPEDDNEAKRKARLLETASQCLNALSESKSKRVKATETLMRAAELKFKLKMVDGKKANELVLTPGQDAREIVLDIMMNRPLKGMLPAATEEGTEE